MATGKASNIFVWILLGLLIVGLAGFGATNFGGSVRSVGTVGNAEIDVDRYARALDQELRAIGAQLGRAMPLTEARDLGVDQAVLQRLVAQAALENEAAELGLSVGDEVVGQEILTVPAFRGIDGEFDREAYAFALENQGMSVAEFEDRIRAETAAALVRAGAVAGVAPPAVFIDTVLAYAREERDITWARMTAADLTDPVAAPSQADLEDHHQANAATFTLPETKVITYAWLTPEMLIDTVEIDRAALEQRYRERIGEFVRPERRLVERLVFGTEADAAAALAAIEAGETTFDALVAERGLGLADVDLGDAARDDLGAAAEAVFALGEPGVVGPLPSPLGPALFRMNAILAAQEITLDDAEPTLRDELAFDRARRVIDDQISEIDDLLAGGATLEDLADETDMVLGAIDWRPGVSDGIAAYESFRTAADALSDRDFPEVAILEDGGIFAMRMDELRPPTLQPLETVRDAVAAGWEAEQVTRALATEAGSIVQALNAGREMAAIDLPLETDRGLLRDGVILTTPADFVAQVFEMAPDELRIVEGLGEVFIVRLDAVRSPGAGDPQSAILAQVLGQQAAQEVSNDLLLAFTNALLAEAGVEINQTAINAVHAQFP